MRFLTAAAAILLVVAVWLTVYALITRWGRGRKKREEKLGRRWADRHYNEMYRSWDATIDSIERLLAQDESRLFLTPSEQIELRAHVQRFEHFQGA